MLWIKRIFYLLFKIYFAVIFTVTLILFYPVFVVFFLNEKWYGAAFKFKKFWSWLIRTLALMPTVVKHDVKLPKGEPYIVTPNHASYLDIVMMFSVIPDYFVFIGKAEILSWPLFGLIFGKMNISVDRDSIKSGHNALELAGKALDDGLRVIIFPEGGIPDSAPEMGKFKNGAFKLAIEKQVPILPVTFLTNWVLFHDMEKMWGRSRPGLAKVVTHKFVSTEGMKQEDISTLRQKIFDIINGGFERFGIKRY